jgi:O-antigen ligase
VQHFYIELFEQPWIYNHTSAWRLFEKSEGGGYKAGGLHFHRLRYAHTLVPLLFVFAPRARRSLAALVTAIALLGLYYTDTRASWVALVAGIVAYALPQLRYAWTAALAVPLFWAGPPDRAVAWTTAKALFLEHPIGGVGYGGYATAALAHMGGVNAQFPYIHLDAHSFALQHLAETGSIGALLFVVCVFLYMRNLRATRATYAIVASLSALGIVHNWPFHPVVLAGAALALALSEQEENVVLGEKPKPTVT